MSRLAGKHVLLIVGGGIAAYKALELIRLLRREGGTVTCVLTAAGARFVTPLSLQALSESRVFSDLWSLGDESEMGHIQLSRAADLVVVAPATADLLARMAAGMADDLAATVLLATDRTVLVAPAMNVRMWLHPATMANMAALVARGVLVVGPEEGEMACHEHGPGRLAEPPALLEAIVGVIGAGASAPVAAAAGRGLAGRRAIVTSGPTHEKIDPVRYLANRSSGRQGHAIAAALAGQGAAVTLVHGPVLLADPPGVTSVGVESAREMLAAVRAAMPCDVFVGAAAVADYRAAAPLARKLKTERGAVAPALALVENPDILAEVAGGADRPRLVIGFAAETEAVLEHAREKRLRKKCDWLLANDVGPDGAVFGAEDNAVTLIAEGHEEVWPLMPKSEVAAILAARIAQALGGG